ncbi:MAG: sterol 3beta-glucosyltransferase [Acidimicrobiaceae bacterium]|jgi:sterol 3beta-glucosyltransferase
MRIVFNSAGYLGDVTAYVPIAAELARRGHDVVYVVPQAFHSLLSGERFDLVHSGTDLAPAALDRDPLHARLITRSHSGIGLARFGRYWVRKWLIEPMAEIVASLDRACDGADVVVCHPVCVWSARLAAEVRGIPVVCADLFPMVMTPSRDYPPPWWPRRTAGQQGPPALNRAAWWATMNIGGRLCYDGTINRARRARGLSAERSHALTGASGATEILQLLSPHYYSPPRDAKQPQRLTGFSVWSGRAGDVVPPDIADFLDADTPPVLVTMGSSASMNSRELFRRVAEVLEDLRLRGLFVTAHAGRETAGAGDHCIEAAFLPLQAVLPRCLAVVESGSYGTHAAALTQGLPTVVVPRMIDQFWHGRRSEDLGCGLLVERGATHAQFRDAISAVTRESRYRSAAHRMRDLLALEDGVARACGEIEAVGTRAA